MTPRVAVLGAGNMAGAMVGTLRRAGFDVTVWNRTAERAEGLAETHGAATAATPAEAVGAADVALSSLADDEAVLATYLGGDGAASGAGPDQVLLEMSTIAPATVLRAGEAVAERGAAFLDAPVSGSVPVVEKGTLTIMVGGDAAAVTPLEPIFDALAAKVFHVGSLGAGATVKLGARKMIRDTRALTGGPFNINLFCHAPARADAVRERRWLDLLAPQFAEYGAAPPLDG